MNFDFAPAFISPQNQNHPPETRKLSTEIKIDNTMGGEDLFNVTIFYQQYGSGKEFFVRVAERVKRGKTALFTLPAGSHPCGFYMLWEVGDFYRWFGDGALIDKVYTDLDCRWRVDTMGDLKVWGGGYLGSASAPY